MFNVEYNPINNCEYDEFKSYTEALVKMEEPPKDKWIIPKTTAKKSRVDLIGLNKNVPFDLKGFLLCLSFSQLFWIILLITDYVYRSLI